MKRLFLFATLLLSLSGFGQSVILPIPIRLSTSVTTNLIFHYAIVSVDRGSPDILAQKAKGLDTILQVKAGRRNFPRTNLTVVTADGKLNSFIVQYAENPDSLNLYFNDHSPMAVSGNPALPALLNKTAPLVQEQPAFINHHVTFEEIRLSLKGIYISQGWLWFRLAVQNQSMIKYQPEYIQFLMRSKQKVKRSAIQEYVLVPAFSSVQAIPGKAEKTILLAFRQFTVPKHQQLVCEMSEEDGGRVLELPISHKTVLKARMLKKIK